jgi:hypothetical protein
LAAAASLIFSTAVSADTTPVDPSAIQPTTGSFGGATPLGTTRTVAHWSGQTTNSMDGVTYGYNIVGADPSSESSTTIGVDIIPLNVVALGASFNGAGAVPGVVSSPVFQNTDFSGTAAIGLGPNHRSGGPLSAGNTGVQLLDATMRSQFDKVGTDYHVILDSPVVFDPVVINVPADKVVPMGPLAAVDGAWFQTRIQSLKGKLHLDPTRLAVFLTFNVVLYGADPSQCCEVGAHGAGHVPGGLNGPVNGSGNQPIQTFVWASWFTPGAVPFWATRDIYSLSHEITEWANDPFNTNTVSTWSSMSAPQYGCSNLFETGDPTFAIGFAAGSNAYDPIDGSYHVSDEAFLPWFMGEWPNTSSQQSQFSGMGRYTLMGDLNPLPWFHHPSQPC